MFPEKIKQFAIELTNRTECGQFSWIYDDENASAYLQDINFSITLRYSFNEYDECGEFVMTYFDVKENKEYRFYTNQRFVDYDVARRLYESAQSSGLRLPF
jgi:hypothetical protein